jgi:hypothetical protein
MSFVYQNITISGARVDTEGASKFIQEASSFLQDAGWQLIDDRSAQAGSATPSLTHKLVFSSNGEAGNYPTFYLTVFSGTAALAGSSLVTFLMSTAYDTAAHDVPSSGVSSSANNIQDSNVTLNTPSEANFEVWMSGDSEGVVFITRQTATYDSVCLGRANSFSTVQENSFPLYINGVSSSSIVVSNANVRGVGGNPPRAFNAGNEISAETTAFASTNQPYDLSTTTSIFLATPIVLMYDDTTPIRKGAAGTIRNAWATAGTNAGVLSEGRLTASGTSGVQTYRVFPLTGEGLLIRET